MPDTWDSADGQTHSDYTQKKPHFQLQKVAEGKLPEDFSFDDFGIIDDPDEDEENEETLLLALSRLGLTTWHEDTTQTNNNM
jgi:hypothetical protein